MERKQQPTTEGEMELLVYKMKCTSGSQIQTQDNKKANTPCPEKNGTNTVLGITLTNTNV